ncbi:MAG: MASE1 domain-containing protein, partial [Gammaproteobacteria bacterium]|nr:MASE1 domain-containing protein [Gammaproteobacteria bacterium]
MSSEEVAQRPDRVTALDPGVTQKGVSILTSLAGIAALAAVYFAAARLSLLLAIPPGYATAVWPASGVALAALLLFGRRLWPGVFLGSLLANIPTALAGGDGSYTAALLMSASIGLGASLQALLGSSLVAPIIRRDPGLLETSAIAGVLGLGGPLACLVSATWGTVTLVLFGVTTPDHAAVQWFTWWTGDVIGVLLVLPLAYIGLGKPRIFWRRRFSSVALPLSLTLVAVTSGFFASDLHERRRLQLEFEREAVIVGDGLTRRLAVYVEVVHSLQSFFSASTLVTRDEFKQYVSRALRRVSGIQALSWNPRIPHSQRGKHEAAAREDGV